MNFLFVFAVLLSIASIRAFGGGVPGSWSTADIRDNAIVEATKFAIEQKFPNLKVEYDLVSAKKQVVAGMNYYMVVNVRNVANHPCQVYHFQVYDRWGTRSLQLSDMVSNHCSSLRAEESQSQ